MQKRIRVLIADDHAVVRTALARVLAIEPDMEVVGEASDGREAVRLAQTVAPDVVVMDVGMGSLSGTEATRCITALHPGVKVIALSMHEGAWMSRAMLQAGAEAYVEKAAPYERLIAAIRAAAGRQFTLVAAE
jgi:DNA-binding NarL/FixJ family response regulator